MTFLDSLDKLQQEKVTSKLCLNGHYLFSLSAPALTVFVVGEYVDISYHTL